MALSVMVMSSGQTLVQHLVMLHRPMPLASFSSVKPVRGVERVHFQGGDVDQETRADELVMHVVIAQDVADVLAQEALDALAELLDAVHVGLAHAPGAVGSIGRARLERLDPLFDPVIPRHVRHQILDQREGPHRLEDHRLIQRHVASRVMHMSAGLPLISAEQEPHLPALQFQRTARSLACSACTRWTASRTTIPSETGVT